MDQVLFSEPSTKQRVRAATIVTENIIVLHCIVSYRIVTYRIVSYRIVSYPNLKQRCPGSEGR